MPIADKLGEEVANRLQLPQNLTRAKLVSIPVQVEMALDNRGGARLVKRFH
jgi:hypothetical protein